tara:strand:+ start:29 stop:289 length:261 start_codon:yes stop_codon:yes gene_type:complete
MQYDQHYPNYLTYHTIPWSNGLEGGYLNGHNVGGGTAEGGFGGGSWIILTATNSSNVTGGGVDQTVHNGGNPGYVKIEFIASLMII